MSPKKAIAKISMPMIKYCTRAGEFPGVIPGFTAMGDIMCVKGEMSEAMLKVKMAHPLPASI